MLYVKSIKKFQSPTKIQSLLSAQTNCIILNFMILSGDVSVVSIVHEKLRTYSIFYHCLHT
jgi:hypothetical protein